MRVWCGRQKKICFVVLVHKIVCVLKKLWVRYENSMRAGGSSFSFFLSINFCCVSLYNFIFFSSSVWCHLGQKELMPLKIISKFHVFFLGDHFHFFLKEFVFFFFFMITMKKIREINNATQIQLHVWKGMALITPFLKIFRQSVVNCDLQSFKKCGYF